VANIDIMSIINDRTGVCCKILGRFLIRGERPIKPGDSWFSTKFFLVRYFLQKLESKVTRKDVMRRHLLFLAGGQSNETQKFFNFLRIWTDMMREGFLSRGKQPRFKIKIHNDY